MDVDYDVVVIGAGPGGYVAAIRCGQLGLKTAIIERESLGGVCLNWGCIPSKSLLKNAEIVSYFHRAEEFGLHFDNFRADYGEAIDRSRKVVERNVRGVEYLLKKNNVEQITGTGSLRGNGVVEVAPDGQKLNAKHIIVATGARPRSIPPLPVDGETVITSRESILLKDLPKSIVIVGGGAIGVEFAYIYHMYGVEVTVVEARVDQFAQRLSQRAKIGPHPGRIEGGKCPVGTYRPGMPVEPVAGGAARQNVRRGQPTLDR